MTEWDESFRLEIQGSIPGYSVVFDNGIEREIIATFDHLDTAYAAWKSAKRLTKEPLHD